MADHESNNRLSIRPQVALQIVAWIVAVMLVYAATNARIAVLESKYDSMRSDISDIRTDVKTLLQRR